MPGWSDPALVPGPSLDQGPSTDHAVPAPVTLRVPGATPTLLPSVTIPGYELLGELGRGGMGVVYKARQEKLNRLVALKVLIGGAFAAAIDKARFRLEAEAVARLQHPNIVQVYDVGEHGGIEYIAFEFVDGPNVRRWQNGRPLDPTTAARLALGVARAVQHAHELGIVHRDLKPANILLAGDPGDAIRRPPQPSPQTPSGASLSPTPKVTDFGLAKPQEGGPELTITGMACGTPNYMAPEQVRGGILGGLPAVDVWGLGAVLFELLTGRAPFVGTDATAIMNEILGADPPNVQSVVPSVPRDLAVIVAKCLEKSPVRRYLSAAAVADDLELFLAGRAILARPVGVARRTTRWVGRNPWAAALGGVLALGLAGATTTAVALGHAADRERSALAEEARLRGEADEATRIAVAANARTGAALRKVEEALGVAGAEKSRAEQNLALARKAVDHVLAVLNKHGTNDPAFFPLYRELLVGVEPFLNQFLAQKDGDRNLRSDQAEVARQLGAIEGTLGHWAESRGYYLRSAALLRGLLDEQPSEVELRRRLGHSLTQAGSASRDLRAADAVDLLRQGIGELTRYAAERPDDPAGIHELIAVHLAASNASGDEYDDRHDMVVLELVDRLEALAGTTAATAQIRAHALNNVASGLTNRGKTDEAEMYWLRVLALREEIERATGGERVARYELAKCLSNYSNQLSRTGRPEQEITTRKRAAGVFDTLRDDARRTPMYVEVMVQNDLNLAGAHAARGDHRLAAERLTRGIDVQSVLVERNPGAVSVSGVFADLHTRRAESADADGRPADAARDYRVAIRFSTRKAHGEYCSGRLFCSLVRAGDRPAAVAHAATIDPEKFTHPFPCVEVARGWMLLARAVREDNALAVDEREKAAIDATRKARSAVLAARKKGMFADPNEVRWFHSQQEFEPIWDVFPR